MNMSVQTSEFPVAWKEALVVPIPKGGDPTLVQNYRPISLLPLPGKILEKLIHKQIARYLEDNSILSHNQHGFRKEHSTVHSIAQLTTHISTKTDIGLPILAAFVDFCKAFDCVQHPVLLKKLSVLGLDDKLVQWFASYLTGQKAKDFGKRCV